MAEGEVEVEKRADDYKIAINMQDKSLKYCRARAYKVVDGTGHLRFRTKRMGVGQRVCENDKSVAAARSTGLRLLHFQ